MSGVRRGLQRLQLFAPGLPDMEQLGQSEDAGICKYVVNNRGSQMELRKEDRERI